MSSTVKVRYPDLSTSLIPNEVIATGDSLNVRTRDDQKSVVSVETGDDGVTILTGPFNDTIVGGSGDDSINGSMGDDVIEGGGGDDTIVGGNGRDSLIGGAGNDSLVGGAGNDFLTVTSGDIANGGRDRDVYVFDLDTEFDPKNLAQIVGFEPEVDQISILENGSSEGPADDISYDPETKTLIVEGRNIVEVNTEDEDFTLTASDIEFDGSDREVSTVDTSEIKVYEFINSSEDVYFYTVDENEKDFIVENLDDYELQEGGGFSSVDPLSGSDVDEVHRFFNTRTGTHLYTTDEVERDYILENLEDYTYEDIKFYGYSSDVDGSMPVYRFLDTDKNIHMFTHSESQASEMSENSMFEDEGIAFYAVPLEDITPAAE